MNPSEVIAWLTAAAGFLTALTLFIKSVKKPDHTVELLNAAIADSLQLRTQVQNLFASSTQAFQEGLQMRQEKSDLEERLAEKEEEIAILHAHENREIRELKADNHRLRNQIVGLEWQVTHPGDDPNGR